MSRLIHLNGVPRVGKSSMARRYGDDHPGTLVLDIDVLVGLIGGWRHDFFGFLGVARSHGRALAGRHLSQGGDVVLPQLVTSHDRDLGFDEVARASGADYLEVVLDAAPGAQRGRLQQKRPLTDVDAHIQALLTDPESDLGDRTQRHLAEYLADRPNAVRLDTTDLTEEQAYALLLRTIG
jgi:predicted kinase